MDRTTDLETALNFVVRRIEEQAKTSGHPLNDEEHSLLKNLPSSSPKYRIAPELGPPDLVPRWRRSGDGQSAGFSPGTGVAPPLGPYRGSSPVAEAADWDRTGARSTSNTTTNKAKNRIKVSAQLQFGLLAIEWISAI